jgi:hypothetical protein
MDCTGFGPADPLYRDAQAAQATTQSLFVRLHYMSCGSGVGEPGRKWAGKSPRHCSAIEAPPGVFFVRWL